MTDNTDFHTSKVSENIRIQNEWEHKTSTHVILT